MSHETFPFPEGILPHIEARGGGGLGLSRLAGFLDCLLSVWRLFKEFLQFAWQEKKWWLIPLILILLVVGALLIFASSSGIAWALYPFF